MPPTPSLVLLFAVYCAADAIRNQSSAWTELSPIFFWDHFWIAFAVAHNTEMMRRIAMISLPKGIILASFWGHFGVQNGLMALFRASGINLGSIWDPGGPHVQNSTIWRVPIFDSFWTNFRQVFVFAWKRANFWMQIWVFVLRLIFERFLNDFEVTFGGQKWSQV